MNKKLLNKTTNNFLASSVIILIFSAPLFYFISHWLYTYETDELLIFNKQTFLEQYKQQYKNNFTELDIIAFNKYNKNSSILTNPVVKKDSIINKNDYDKIARENIPYRILYSPIEINKRNYTYYEKINLVEIEEMVWSIALMFLLVITLFLIGIIFISKRFSKKIWEPFYDTLNQIHNFEIDKNKQPKFIPTDIQEFDSLNKSLEKLIENNTTIYKNQKEFIENAAHELQTPLALFQSKIDILIQTSGLSKEQSVLLNALNNDVSRLNRLNKNLLLLSKIENNSYFEKQSYSVNEYINKNLNFFKEQAKAKNIKISTHFTPILKIETHAMLIEVLINNLFLNAIRHNIKDGIIKIAIENNSLIFTNTGQNNPLNKDKLFNRFSKSGSSTRGNGLGLAIIKKILELNNWTIDYTFEKNLHKFSIHF